MSIDTVSDLTPSVQYVALAAQTDFDYTFPIFADEDLVVYVDSDLMVLNDDYTVDGAGDDTGGTITLDVALTGNEIVTIYRDISIARATDIGQNGAWSSRAYNDEQDKIFLILQELAEANDRAVHLSRLDDTSVNLELPLAADRAGYFFAFDSNGAVSMSSGTGNDSSLRTDLAAGVAALVRQSAISIPRSNAEANAGVTPVNYFYQVGEVDRYGTNTLPGTTDMTAAFNAAFKVAKSSGCDVVYGRTWPYLLTSTIDATQDAGSDQYGYSVRNIGNNAAHTLSSPVYPTILANHTGYVFDCAGAIAINWYDANVGSVSGTEQKCVWYCARNSAGSSTVHRWVNSRVIGNYSKCVRYLYGIEENDASGEFFYNATTTAGACIEIVSTNNLKSLSSGIITIATGARSQRAVRRTGGSYIMPSGSATSDLFLLDQAEHFYLMNSFVANTGRSIVGVDSTTGATNFCHLTGVEVENGVEPAYGVCFIAAPGATTHSGWTIADSYLRADTRAVYAGTNNVLDNFKYANITEASSLGLEVVGTIQGSNLFMPSLLTIGTSSRNFIVGVKANMTITSRSNDVIVDTFTGSVDAKGSLTLGGAFGCNGATPQAAVAGFGTPTGASVIANFPGATATLGQTSATVAEILTILKANGQIAT